MNPFIKKSLLWLFGGLITLLLLAFILAAIFQDKIGKELIVEMNNQLKSELKVGDFELSLISSFPSAAVNLKDIELKDAFGKMLLEAKKVSFRFDLFSLFGSNIMVHSVELNNGKANILIDRKGRANYDILKVNESTEGNSNLKISLEEAGLYDMKIKYRDKQTKKAVSLNIEDLVASGQFYNEKFYVKSTLQAYSDYVELGKVRYLVGKEIAYDAKVFVNMTSGVYDLENVKLELENNVFKAGGIIEQIAKDETSIDLVVTSEEANLESLISILPRNYLKHFGDFKSKGLFKFNADFYGLISQTENPAIDVSVSLEDGKISSRRLENELKDVSFEASFTNGEDKNNQASLFKLSSFKGYFNRELIELDLEVKDLDDPMLDFHLDGVLPLASIYGLFNNEVVTEGKGEIEIKDLNLKGRYRNMLRKNRISRVDLSGQIEFDDAGLVVNREELIIDKGILTFKDNLLKMDNVKIEGAGTEIHLEGNFHNVLPVLFADSLNTQKAELEFVASLYAPKIDIERLIRITDVTVEKGAVKQVVYDSLKVANAQKRERVANYLKGTFDAKIDAFQFKKIQGTDFVGNLKFDQNEMDLKGAAKGMDGDFNLNGTLYFEEKPRLRSQLICNDVNIKEFFRQTENFGMKLLQSKNLEGIMEAKIALSAQWDEEGNYQDDKLRVLAALGVKNGELKGLKILEDFSDYVNVKDLRHVKFTNMQNWIEIRKSNIYMPAMFVQTNAMNLMVSGEHSFDNEIDYNIQINAGQVLANKFKKHNSKFKPIKAKKKGLFNMYFNIVGTMDDFEYKTARRQVKANFRLSEHRQREIKAALRKEFADIYLLDDAEIWRDIPDSDESVDEDEFIDWDNEVGGR